MPGFEATPRRDVDTPTPPQQAGGGILSKAVELEEARPESLLRLGMGRPRGFWAREGKWVAHFGEVASVSVPEGADASERFTRSWESSLAILRGVDGIGARGDESVPTGGPEPYPSRMYGGFSFGDDHRAEGIWSGFPPARFILPEVELSSGPEAFWLRVRVGVDEAGGARKSGIALERRTEEILDLLSKATATAEASSVSSIQTTTDKGAWLQAVAKAVEAIDAGDISKVVLARTLDVETDRALNPVEVLGHLWRSNPKAHVFLFEPDPGACFIGAAPETIATLTGGSFRATAVAGTVARGASDEEQKALAQRLLSSEKDTTEHAIAVNDMVARLEGLGLQVAADDVPHVLTLAGIQHLESRLQAAVPSGLEVLRILKALHPTPAVCGLPRDAAFAYLHREEPFERGWYAGPVGWFDGWGDGVFVPALRSAVVRENRWRLFAGAGIVAGSDPEAEWEETRIKFQPVLQALAECGVE